ncbi:unnamed protein product [Polarella glacialis]|uniref:Uncharacterized protein n=1 Tax=Polarella glacialis TaxID=89957 RepID=A0A813DU26_POLGL|nr:unnamed protein product [Polarella glacialis]CAE8633903.1 unnamed protein product [Polarella glacialis]
MAPKSAAAKPRAAAGAGPSKAGPDEKWLNGQLKQLEAQRAASSSDGDWVLEPHQWHEARLNEVLARLLKGSLVSLPAEFREGVEFYVSQLADGPSALAPDAFYDDRELYALLPQDTAGVGGENEVAYQRPADDEEALKAIEKIRAWSETSPHGISNLAKLLKAHQGSALAQEAGLVRIGGLLGEQRGKALEVATQGLAPRALMALIEASVLRFPRDPLLQRVGCNAIRAVALSEGGLGICLEAGGAKKVVAVMRAFITNAEVCRTAAATLAAMANKGKDSSVEMSRIREAGAEAILMDVLPYHSNDLQLDKIARTIIPFLRG